MDIIVSLKLAANEQLSRTPAVLGNVIDQRFNTNNSKIKSLLLQKIILKFWEWRPPKQIWPKKRKEILRNDTLRISRAVV